MDCSTLKSLYQQNWQLTFCGDFSRLIAFLSFCCEKTAMTLGLACIRIVFAICQVFSLFDFPVTLLLVQSYQAKIIAERNLSTDATM